jgi:hypothetical protein
MANLTIKAGLNSLGFRSGLKEMEAEARNFRAAFKRNIENGGGLFGSIDAALGKLASGRFAGQIAAIGAALGVARVASEAMSKYWDNVAASTDRARQNIEAIQSTRGAVAGQKFQGDAANAELARASAERAGEAAQAAREAGEIADPSTFAGLRKTANTLAGSDGPSMSGFYHFMMLAGGRLGIPGMGKGYEAVNELYNERKQRAQETRNAAEREAQLRPFTEFQNATAQRAGVAAQIAAEDRLGVAQGRTTGFEAAANALLLANQQFEETKRMFGDNDPRTQQARGAALDAFTAYDSEITQARRFRNDPTIAADSLARLGGGGGVNVFGDGRGELLFEQKRLNTSISGLTRVLQTLNVTLSRANLGGDVD